MKKIILISVLLYSCSYAYSVKLNQVFTKEIKPSSIYFRTSLSVVKPTSTEVIKKLDGFSKFVSNFKKLKISGGKYNTYPEYAYENKVRVKKSYRGSINFRICSKSKKDIKIFLDKLSKLYGKDGLIISSSDWQIDEKTISKAKERLRHDAISWGKSYAKRIDKKCHIKEIDFTKKPSYIPYTRDIALKSSNGANDIPLPKQELKKVSIDVDFRFECL
jgi:uncharacterized protein YggE